VANGGHKDYRHVVGSVDRRDDQAVREFLSGLEKTAKTERDQGGSANDPRLKTSES
jgi:hypothetical protein